MNNYTTARAPLRLSELSSILEQRISQPAPAVTPETKTKTAPAIKARRKSKTKKS